MRKLLMLAGLLLATLGASAQTSFYTDRAVGTFPLGHGVTTLIPIQYGQVRVCNSPAVGTPCSNLASITDLSGNPLSVVGGNFGQITTDVVGRFNFGCPSGQAMAIQVAPASSNVPLLNYSATCTASTLANIIGASNTWTALQTFNGGLTATSVQSIFAASNFSGADWCAKAANAITALNNSVGIVQINQAAGTSACAAVLVVPSNVKLQFTQPGTWTTACANGGGNSGGITVLNASNVELEAIQGVVLTLPNSCADSSRVIAIQTSTGVSVHGFELNGNGNNQASGQQSHCLIGNDSNRVKVYNNYIHDCQGDGVIVNTDNNMTAGCEDWEINHNSFFNIGRQFVTLSGFGCNDWRVTDDYFQWATNVTKSTTTGNPIHIEADNNGTGFNRMVVARNVINGTGTSTLGGVCISISTGVPNPLVSVSIEDNYCFGTNSSVANSGGVVLFSGQHTLIRGNTFIFSGATSGTIGMQIAEIAGQAAGLFRLLVDNNTVDGTTSGCINLANGATSGTATSFEFASNICNNTGTGSGGATGAINILAGSSTLQFTEVNIHDNIITGVNGDGIDMQGVNRFSVHHNIIRNFGLGGGAASGISINCTTGGSAGPGSVTDNSVGSTTTTSKTGLREDCPGAVAIFHRGNDLSANAASVGFFNGAYTGGLGPVYEDQAPTASFGAGIDLMWPDVTGHRWKMSNNNGAADTVVGAATTDTFSNKSTAAGALVGTVASGTTALPTASVTTATCNTGTAATATGVVSTDTVDASLNAAPTATNKYGAFLVVYAVASTNTVTLYVCNPSATTSTPTAMSVNWAVRR